MISVTVLTKNAAATLPETLGALLKFPEVVVYDTGSTDGTQAIAASFPNVRLMEGEFRGFGRTHNEASSLATHPWVLSIDSDEVVSPELADEILSLDLTNRQVVYAIHRDNYFRGKKMRSCAGWYPDIVLRLYHRDVTSFSSDAVHERILANGCTVRHLRGSLRHTPYRSASDLLAKMQAYSSLFAEQHRGRKKSSVGGAFLRGMAAFCKSYFLKWGIFGGAEGLIISIYNGQTTFYKYLKLSESSH
jgi:glycosyltransferase involved in cell wall biosynthesis